MAKVFENKRFLWSPFGTIEKFIYRIAHIEPSDERMEVYGLQFYFSI